MMQLKLTAAADMGIGDAAITALLGYAVVFFGLVLLMLVITALGRVMVARAKTAASAQPEAAAPAAPVQAAPAEEAPGSAGELDLHGVAPQQAALIMAIVAHRLGKPLNQLRFKSIREVKDNEI